MTMHGSRCAAFFAAMLIASCVRDEATLVESCPAGLTACAGQCVDTALHPEHCGACEQPCPEGELCSISQCGVECLGGTKQCGDLCVDVTVDPNNCGDCDNPCKPNEPCSEGVCGTPKSCLDILTNGSAIGDGIYAINPNGNNARFVHCDMTTDGGGWTLVGRSAVGATMPGCAPDAGILIEGAAFEPTSEPLGTCLMVVPSAPTGQSCENGCGWLCSVGHLDYTVTTEVGTAYTITLKIADYLHNCVDPISAHVEADGASLGTWQSMGTNAWAYPSFQFTANAASTLVRVFLDIDYCCECTATCNVSCSPLVGDANIYLDQLVVTPSQQTPFGWSSASGTLEDDTAAYSLDAAALGLAFDEILFGNYADGKTWGDYVYRLALGANFVARHQTDAVNAGTAVSVTGTCPDGPTHLSWAGFTASTDAFRMNGDGSNAFGLTSLGWRTCFDDCDRGGALNGTPGMIFVR